MRQLFNIVMGVNIQVVESQDQKRNKISSANLISHIAFLVFLFLVSFNNCSIYCSLHRVGCSQLLLKFAIIRLPSVVTI